MQTEQTRTGNVKFLFTEKKWILTSINLSLHITSQAICNWTWEKLV